MGRSRKERTDAKKACKKPSTLALKWEKIQRIRSRFRRGQPWLKFAKRDEGEDIVQCTKSVAYNFETLMAVIQTLGLALVPIKFAEKIVARVDLDIFFLPQRHPVFQH